MEQIPKTFSSSYRKSKNKIGKGFDNRVEGEAMRQLWAPWRMVYILKEKEEGCIFCLQPNSDADRDRLVLYRGTYAFVMINRFPYNNGHLMVAPLRHCIDLESLTLPESRELFELLKVSIRVLKRSLLPEGFNIGVNIGKAGGAGEEHIHFHIVPRWVGDTNFMPILSETKIVPEHLSKTYEKLHAAFLEQVNKGAKRKGGRRK